MLHEIHKIQLFKIVAPYTLEILFEDNNYKTINFLPVLKGEMFGPLKNLDCFNKARLDSEANTIVWPNGADFDPALLYNWEHYIAELTERAKQWSIVN